MNEQKKWWHIELMLSEKEKEELCNYLFKEYLHYLIKEKNGNNIRKK